ncbi:hypothetical protein AKJ16_DCAP12673 [Drosera capensis]
MSLRAGTNHSELLSLLKQNGFTLFPDALIHWQPKLVLIQAYSIGLSQVKSQKLTLQFPSYGMGYQPSRSHGL